MCDKEDARENAINLLNWFNVIYGKQKEFDTEHSSWDMTLTEWTDTLSKLSLEESRKACKWFKTNSTPGDVPPSPKRFTFKAKGLPDTAIAFLRATTSNFLHPAVVEAKKRIGSYTWKMSRIEDLENKFTWIYGQVCNEIIDGTLKLKELTPEPYHKQKDKDFKPNIEVATEALKKIKNILGNKLTIYPKDI